MSDPQIPIPTTEEPNRFKSFFKKQVWPFVWVLAVFGTMRSAIADWNDVPTGSMNPTIIDGDRIFVNKLAYGLRVPFTQTWIRQWSGPKRGDIVVFSSPKDGTRLVKRTIGLPGDVIQMQHDVLIINGQPAQYQNGPSSLTTELPSAIRSQQPEILRETVGDKTHAVLILPMVRAIRDFSPITIPAGKYLMLGDSRDNSMDSRYWGFVDRDLIAGRAVGVAFSLDYDDWYLPRLDRFFKGLE